MSRQSTVVDLIFNTKDTEHHPAPTKEDEARLHKALDKLFTTPSNNGNKIYDRTIPQSRP